MNSFNQQNEKIELLQLLGEIGLMAVSHGRIDAAHSIFEYLSTVRPNSFLPDLGFALIAMQKNQFSAAMEKLQRHSDSEDYSDFASAFLCLASYLNKDYQTSLNYGEKARSSNDSSIAKLAEELVGEIEQRGE